MQSAIGVIARRNKATMATLAGMTKKKIDKALDESHMNTSKNNSTPPSSSSLLQLQSGEGRATNIASNDNNNKLDSSEGNIYTDIYQNNRGVKSVHVSTTEPLTCQYYVKEDANCSYITSQYAEVMNATSKVADYTRNNTTYGREEQPIHVAPQASSEVINFADPGVLTAVTVSEARAQYDHFIPQGFIDNDGLRRRRNGLGGLGLATGKKGHYYLDDEDEQRAFTKATTVTGKYEEEMRVRHRKDWANAGKPVGIRKNDLQPKSGEVIQHHIARTGLKMTPVDKPVQIEPPIRRKKMDVFKEDYLGMENKEAKRQRKSGGVDVTEVGN